MSDAGLSVVIPSRDGASRLPETLRSVARQEVGCSVEVVVVDDGSRDGTREVAAATSLPWGSPVVLRHESARGRAAARNRGLAAARAPAVLLLDDDMTLRPGALETHRLFHSEGTGAAALGRVLQAPGTRSSCFARFLDREQTFREDALLRARNDVPFILFLTGHVSAPRNVLIDGGGFDEAVSRYGFEDIEMGYRLTRRGVRIAYLPEAVSIHRAFVTDLDRYLARQREAGLVARQLAARHGDGPFREYLRVDGPKELGIGKSPAGLVGLRAANRLLLRRPVRRLAGSSLGFGALRALLAVGERLGLERSVHFGYHVARDIRFFQGCFDDPDDEGVA